MPTWYATPRDWNSIAWIQRRGAGKCDALVGAECRTADHSEQEGLCAGEDIELSIKAPYTGAGLITIERDHVYATQWFKTTTTASVQKIRVPNDFEGNGYVSVQFIRDLGSDEIFTSPLSYGVAPFMTSLAQRTNVLKLQLPELVKPGAALHMKLNAAHPTRAVLFAVDEGILQVAHYQTPDPLGEFFKKRALEVRTAQILDLILPEFKRIMAAAAPGGDGEAALRRNLNPFKKKRDKPAVYWSGIVDVGLDHDFTWTVPTASMARSKCSRSASMTRRSVSRKARRWHGAISCSRPTCRPQSHRATNSRSAWG